MSTNEHRLAKVRGERSIRGLKTIKTGIGCRSCDRQVQRGHIMSPSTVTHKSMGGWGGSHDMVATESCDIQPGT